MKYQFSRKPVKVSPVQTKYRTIKTEIPTPGTEAVLSQLDKYESRSMHGQMPIVWERAKDFNIFDKAGNKWIDFTSTIFVTNVGHANPRVTAAIREVLDRPLLHNYVYAHELRAKYVKKLVEFAGDGFEKAFLLSAGTEATEAGLKLMRLNGIKKGKSRPGVICIEGNYHGRTMGAHTMSTRIGDKDWVGFQDPNIHYFRFPYPWAMNGKSGSEFLKIEIDKLAKTGVDIKKDICGFMLETYQGWGAVFYPDDFVKGIEEICGQNGILLAFDEMQSGFARTGKKFGYEHYKVRPNLICCGKGMGSGVPLSGVIGSTEIMDLPQVGEMSSTHSAGPLVCAAGLATLEEIEERELVKESARKGEILHKGLNKIKDTYHEVISMILGKGMVAGVIFKNDAATDAGSLRASRISERGMQKGLLVVHTGRESIKIAPPLIIPDDALLEGIEVFNQSCKEVLEEQR